MQTKAFYYVVLGVAVILALIIITVAIMNGQPVPFNLFGATLPLSIGGTLIGAWVAGLIGSVAVWQTKIAEARSEKKIQKWEVQDQKLAKEVASDTVKLLEAKIATLEVALSKALEKKKS